MLIQLLLMIRSFVNCDPKENVFGNSPILDMFCLSRLLVCKRIVPKSCVFPLLLEVLQVICFLKIYLQPCIFIAVFSFHLFCNCVQTAE